MDISRTRIVQFEQELFIFDNFFRVNLLLIFKQGQAGTMSQQTAMRWGARFSQDETDI